MKRAHSLSLALALAAVGVPAWAAQHDKSEGHHPAGSAPPAAASPRPGKTTPEMARMDNHLKSMREMRDKMMAAKTPEERDALSAEHKKTMQEGMALMNEVSPGGMAGMKGGMAGMGGEMGMHHPMMEKRMDMMQSMMQMMMDRLPAAPAKP